MEEFLAEFGEGNSGGRRSGVKEISVGKSDLVSAKNRRESAKNLVFGRMGIFLAVFLAHA